MSNSGMLGNGSSVMSHLGPHNAPAAADNSFNLHPSNDSSLRFFDPNLDVQTFLQSGAVGGNAIDPEDQDYMKKLTHYLMGIGGSIVCCLGTIANAMSVAVLTRPVMKSSTYMYLAALAVCDSLVLFFTLLLVLKDTRPPDSPHELDTFHAILYPFVHPTAIVFQVTSIWLTLAFTVDRYIMICHPFKAEHMCRKSRARRVVVGIYIGGFLFNIPKYLENYTKTDEFKIANSTHVYKTYGVMTTDIGNNELFRKIVHSWGYLIFVCGIPFLTLVILNAFLIRAVRESRLKGKEINPKEKHRNDTTIMLIGVIIIFLICQGPALASRMTYAFKPGTTRNRAYFTLNEVASFLVILNSAINIVPYYLFGKKFRSEFWRIFCACFMDKDEIRRIARSYSVSMDHRRMSNYNVMEMNGIASGYPKNEAQRTSNNAIHLCGTGTTNTASYNSNLYDETAPNHGHGTVNKSASSTSLGDVKLNDSGGGGGGGGRSVNCNSGVDNGQYLALPLIHNSHHSSLSSPTSYTADLVTEAPKSDFKDETSNLTARCHPRDAGSPSLSTSSLYNYLSNLSHDLRSNSNISSAYFTTVGNPSDNGGNGSCNDDVGGDCSTDVGLNNGGGVKSVIASCVVVGSGDGESCIGGVFDEDDRQHDNNNSNINIDNDNAASSPLIPPGFYDSSVSATPSSHTANCSCPLPSLAAAANSNDYSRVNKHREDTGHKLKRNSVKPAIIHDYLPHQQSPSSSSSLTPTSSPLPSSSSSALCCNHLTTPTSTNSYVKALPGLDKRNNAKDVLVPGSSKGSKSSHHGKYMSLATTTNNNNSSNNNNNSNSSSAT